MYPETHPLHGMTQERWNALGHHGRDAIRDLSGLTPQLHPFEGMRIKVLDHAGATPRRFWVGKSTGWRPCHLEIKTRRSMGGDPTSASYFAIRVIDGGPR